MKRGDRKVRKSGNGFAVISAVGVLLMFTEMSGGAWAGTFVGCAMFVLGGLAYLREKKYL